MKSHFNNILFSFLFIALLSSCSDDEVRVNPTDGLTKISEGYALGASARVEVWAEEKLFAGYNRLYVALFDSITNQRITDSHVYIQPQMDMHSMVHSCPVEQPGLKAVDNLFPAAVLFTMPSSNMGGWTLELNVHNHNYGKSGVAVFSIDVSAKTPAAALSFVEPSTNKKFYLGYKFSAPIKVGVNEFELVAYSLANGEFVPAQDLTIQIAPEMPSMDHGSLNNVNPVHTGQGHYKGKVNFTMTGEWRINLAMKDGETASIAKYFEVVVN